MTRLSEHLIPMVAVVGIALLVIVYGIAEINMSIKYMDAHPSLKDLTWWEAMLMGGDLAVHWLYYKFDSFWVLLTSSVVAVTPSLHFFFRCPE